MGELIRIGAPEGTPGFSAVVDTTGACVTQLALDGTPVFFERQTIDYGDGNEYTRGGMHVCYPYHGEDPEGLGPRHGYARNSEWAVGNLEKEWLLRLALLDEELPENVITHIAYRAEMDRFSARLNVPNFSNRALRVSPGFHPYFNGSDVNNECGPQPQNDTRTKEIAGKPLLTEREIVLESGLRVVMRSSRLPSSITWTDRPDHFFCVEPTAIGLERHDVNNVGLVGAGEIKSFEVSIARS